MKRIDCQDFAVHCLENKKRAIKIFLRETSAIWNLTDKQSSPPMNVVVSKTLTMIFEGVYFLE